MSFLKRFQTSLESFHRFTDTSDTHTTNYVVAYSGGVDSHVLLYCCKQLNLSVRAVHVHHGLQSVADEWVEHCQNICDSLSIKLDVLYVDAQKQTGQSPEEAARKARYAALESNMTSGECLITAQHENDQAETLLLQLFRTAGSAGLSAMPEIRRFGPAVHIRPLLKFSRTEIEDFASDNVLQWIEDPSNHDTSLDRNFVRKQILPKLQERWPEITSQLSRVASLQSDNLQVLEDMAAIDLSACVQTPTLHLKTGVYETLSVLSIPFLQKLSSARRLNILRYWVLRSWGMQDDSAKIDACKINKVSPTRNLLHEIEKVFLHSDSDVKSKINFSGFELRKYQDSLFLLKQTTDNSIDDICWDLTSPLEIAELKVRLRVIEQTDGNAGLKPELFGEAFSLRFRKGGERFHPAGRGHSQSLKKLFQEAGVPPWQRDVVPLLYFNDELIAVVGLWVSQEYAVAEGDTGWNVAVVSL